MPRKKNNVKNKDVESKEVEKMHPKEVEEYVKDTMRYHNITKIEQKDELLQLVKEQIGDKTEDIVIIRSFEMLIDPLSIYFK